MFTLFNADVGERIWTTKYADALCAFDLDPFEPSRVLCALICTKTLDCALFSP